MSEYSEQPDLPQVDIPRPVTMAVREPECSALEQLGAALAAWHTGLAPAASALHNGLDAASRVAGQLRVGGMEGGLGLGDDASLSAMPNGMASLVIGVGRYKLHFWLDVTGQFCSGTWSDELAQAALLYTVSTVGGLWQLSDPARGAGAAVMLDGPLPNWTTSPQQSDVGSGGLDTGAAIAAGAALLGIAAAGAALLTKKKEAPPPVPVRPAFVVAIPTGAGAGGQVALTGRARIGSALDNEVCVSGPGVAPVHAFIEPRGDYCAVWDNGTGGTTVNGYLISQAVMARPGDVIVCGKVELRLLAGAR